MAMDNSAHICQANSCPFELRRPMKPLEYAEELMRVSHIKPHAIIPDKNHIFVRGGSAPDGNLGLGPRARVFQSVSKEVEHHLPQQRRISLHLREVLQL